jgi:transposase
MSTTGYNQPNSWREVRRQRAWALHQQGWTQSHIATALGVTQGVVSKWLARAINDTPSALADRPKSGRPPTLQPDQLAQLVQLLTQGAQAHGFLGDVWTRRRVAQLIKEKFAVSFHVTHVGRLLKLIDWTPQKPIIRATQRDEAAITAWHEQRWPALKKSACMKDELSSG